MQAKIHFCALAMYGFSVTANSVDLDESQRRAYDEMEFIERETLVANYKFEELSAVKSISCQRTIYSPPPTINEAHIRIRESAAKLNASAVTDISCKNRGFDVLNNCISSVICKGVAVKFDVSFIDQNESERNALAEANGYRPSASSGLGRLVLSLRSGSVKSSEVKGYMIKFDSLHDFMFTAISVTDSGVVFEHPSFPNLILVTNLKDYIEGNRLSGRYFGYDGTGSINVSGSPKQVMLFRYIE